MTLSTKAKTLANILEFEGKKVVYVCGKVTGLPHFETFMKFIARQDELEAKGYAVINPMDLVHPKAEWQDAMKICINALPHADYVSLLHDWQDSKGATLEKELCDKLGIAVLPHE